MNNGHIKRAKIFAYFVLLITSASSVGGSRADTSAKAQRSVVTCPFALVPGLGIVVHSSLNNQEAVSLVVDTGSYFNYLDTSVAARLKLPLRPINFGKSPLVLEGQPAQAVIVQSNVIGTGDLQGSLFVVKPKTKLPHNEKIQADGVLGLGMYSKYAFLFDFSRHELTIFYPGGLSPDELKNAGFDGAFGVPITISPAGLWFLPVEVTNGSVTSHGSIIIDTGAVITTITLQMAKQLNLKPDFGGNVVAGFNKKIAVERANVSRLEVSGLRVENLTVYYPTEDTSALPGSLGMNVLLGYRMLIDFAQNKLYLKSPLMSVPIRIGPTSEPYAPPTTK